MHKRKRIWLVLGAMVIVLLLLEFAPKTVIYQGENKEWQVTLQARLFGNEASNTLTITYKGEEKVTEARFHIWPLARSGTLLPEENDQFLPPQERINRAKKIEEFAQSGVYVERCEEEHCEYFDDEKELLFTILWKEENARDYRLERISLKRKKKWFSRAGDF